MRLLPKVFGNQESINLESLPTRPLRYQLDAAADDGLGTVVP